MGALCLALPLCFLVTATTTPAVQRTHALAHPPALVAAADKVILLHAVREKLRAAKGQPDLTQEFWQAGLSVLTVIPHPGQGRFKDLPEGGTSVKGQQAFVGARTAG